MPRDDWQAEYFVLNSAFIAMALNLARHIYQYGIL